MKREQQPVFSYDPNLVRQCAIQTVRLVFGQWDYRAELTVSVGGNCSGFVVLDAAVSSAYDKLPSEPFRGNNYAKIILKNSKGEELICNDDELEEEEWLKGLLISAEITSIAPDYVNRKSR